MNRGRSATNSGPDAQAVRGGALDAGPADPGASPAWTHGPRLSFLFLALFAVTYFGTAIVTSAAFAEFAALRIAGLPLGFLLGLVVIVVGIIAIRVQLTRGER